MIKLLILCAGCLCVLASPNCSFDADMFGRWSTTNLETVTIQSSSPQFSMSKTFTGSTTSTTDFDCVAISGTQHVLKSTTTLTVFSGTQDIYLYMCIDLRRSSNASFNYYLNSPIEVGLSGQRIVGIITTEDVTDPVARVCTVTLDDSNYEVMLKIGDELQAAHEVQCPDVLRGKFNYTYTDSTGTYCSTSIVSMGTNENFTLITVDSADCTSVPRYSSGGSLGCITTFTNATSQISYTTLYNLDATVDDSTTYRLICVVSTSDSNGKVYLSIKPTVCDSGQVPTVLPTGGATMELTSLFSKLGDVCNASNAAKCDQITNAECNANKCTCKAGYHETEETGGCVQDDQVLDSEPPGDGGPSFRTDRTWLITLTCLFEFLIS